jgi:hypothetical protein
MAVTSQLRPIPGSGDTWISHDRLLYVGCTRAREIRLITYSGRMSLVLPIIDQLCHHSRRIVVANTHARNAAF